LNHVILVGDVRDRLADLETGSVHCVVTSPPYFNLRDYGTAEWENSDPGCDHIEDRHPSALNAGFNERWGNAPGERKQEDMKARQYRSICRKCGATRVDNQIGLEPTLAEYIASLVDVFRAVRRVLRDDGTVWLNLGDSYAANRTYRVTDNKHTNVGNNGAMKVPEGLKPKDLMMVPARVAIALCDDGWYLRSDIIWAKPNPMPESVQDRCTSAHEHVFMLTKKPRYFYDADAIREEHTAVPFGGKDKGYAPAHPDHGTPELAHGPSRRGEGRCGNNPSGRNKRNVWTISTTPYPGAHFATFPPKLVEPMILAGTSERGCCPACGAPWVRVVERKPNPMGINGGEHREPGRNGALGTRVRDLEAERSMGSATTLRWSPSCPCPAADPIPCTVLDPFLGSGTSLMVADWRGRNGIGIELKREYAEMARDRICSKGTMFTSVEVKE
jgi:DNA modification methylase